MQLVGRQGERVAVQAELDPTTETCARTVDGLVGLGMTFWVPRTQLLSVVIQEVTLQAEGCATIVAQPGVVATPLCERDGVPHYRIGNCPTAECAYPVPADALGYEARARPRAEASATHDEAPEGHWEREFPMPCLDRIDEAGGRQPLTRFARGSLPAIGIGRYAQDHPPGALPSCNTLGSATLSCDVPPRLGFDHVSYQIREGAPITWRDGTSATTASEALRFRAVPRQVEGRLCWGAVEGESAADDLELCTAPDAVRRVDDAHAVVLQTRRDGKPTRRWFDRPASDCYVEARKTASDLHGRVRARYRVHDGGATLGEVTGERQAGDEAFAACLAPHLASDDGGPYVLDIIVDLFAPLTASAGPPPQPEAGSHPSRARSPADRRR